MKIKKSRSLEGANQILESPQLKQLQALLVPKIKEMNPRPKNFTMLNSRIMLFITILRLNNVTFIKKFGMCNAESKRQQSVKFFKPRRKLIRKLLLS